MHQRNLAVGTVHLLKEIFNTFHDSSKDATAKEVSTMSITIWLHCTPLGSCSMSSVDMHIQHQTQPGDPNYVCIIFSSIKNAYDTFGIG